VAFLLDLEYGWHWQSENNVLIHKYRMLREGKGYFIYCRYNYEGKGTSKGIPCPIARRYLLETPEIRMFL
jgi:hypothetical protein